MSILPLQLQALTAAFTLQDVPLTVTAEYPLLRFTAHGDAVQMTVYTTTEGLNVIVDHVSANGERGGYSVVKPHDSPYWHVSKPYTGPPPPVELCWTHEFGTLQGDTVGPPASLLDTAPSTHPTTTP